MADSDAIRRKLVEQDATHADNRLHVCRICATDIRKGGTAKSRKENLKPKFRLDLNDRTLTKYKLMFPGDEVDLTES